MRCRFPRYPGRPDEQALRVDDLIGADLRPVFVDWIVLDVRFGVQHPQPHVLAPEIALPVEKVSRQGDAKFFVLSQLTVVSVSLG